MQSSQLSTQQEAVEGANTDMCETRTLVFKWELRGINSYLVYYKGGLRPSAAIFVKGVQDNVILGFTTTDLVAV